MSEAEDVANADSLPVVEIDRATPAHYIVETCPRCHTSGKVSGSSFQMAHYIVETCPRCHGTHRHGAVPELEPGETTRRGAHCPDDPLGEYRLRMTETTERGSR